MTLKSLRNNKFAKISSLLIIIIFFVTFTGLFEILFMQYQAIFTLYLDSIHFPVPLTFYLDSGVLMIGMGIGISSIFVKNRNFFFYVSVMSVLLGFGILAIIMGYANPDNIGSGIQVDGPGSFFVEYLNLVIHNIITSFAAFLSGPTIIGPYLVLSYIIIIPVSWLASLVAFYGYKGIILFLGMFHIYLEFYAIFLACLAGIRVTLDSFESFLCIRKVGFKSSLWEIKNTITRELRNTMLKVMILLMIAAFLETLWTPFWINYWLQHIL